MATQRHLRNAPITEAIIDVRVRLPDDTTAEKLGAARAIITKEYPEAQEQRQFAATFEFKGGGSIAPSAPTGRLNGYLYKSADGVSVVQFRLDGFTFNRLKPYSEWRTIFPEAMRLWRLYREIARPVTVTRLATRFINQLKVPGAPSVEYARYLTDAPKSPQGAPSRLDAFLTRVEVRDPDDDVTAIVTQATEKATETGFTVILLDIDTYQIGEWQPGSPEIERQFARLHDVKNSVFFAAITEETARAYE